MEEYRRSFLTVDLGAIRHNLSEIRKRIGDNVKLLTVIKADGYGHGAVAVGLATQEQSDYFGVACLEEAVSLREAGMTKPILILGYTSPKQFDRLLSYDILPCIYRREDAEALSVAAQAAGKMAAFHLVLDSGMGRIGFLPCETDADTVAEIVRFPGLRAEGLFTHFAKADEEDPSYTLLQEEKLRQFLALLQERGVTVPLVHACNSAGIAGFPAFRYDMVRAGIVVYGLKPSEETDLSGLMFRPAMEWKSHVIHVKTLPAGCGISYGSTYVTDRETRVATVCIGYADGYPRSLSNRGSVLIRGKRAPILGRICMDQMMVDVTDIPDVQVEDTVTLIGRDGDDCLTVEEMAALSGRFNYEFVCDISPRVHRVYVE